MVDCLSCDLNWVGFYCIFFYSQVISHCRENVILRQWTLEVGSTFGLPKSKSSNSNSNSNKKHWKLPMPITVNLWYCICYISGYATQYAHNSNQFQKQSANVPRFVICFEVKATQPARTAVIQCNLFAEFAQITSKYYTI